MWILFLGLLILSEALADILAKEWSVKGFWLRALAAIVAYVIANIFWLFALDNGSGLARGSIIFSVASAVLGSAIGIYLYREELSALQYAGIALGIVAIGLILWEG
jgi:small multidrug resistance pump